MSDFLKSMILQNRMDQREGPYKNEFWLFLNTNFPSCVMVLKLSKKVQFLQFCIDLSKKPKSVKTIYIYASESSRHTLSENDIVYKNLIHRLWDISD